MVRNWLVAIFLDRTIYHLRKNVLPTLIMLLVLALFMALVAEKTL